MGKLIGIGFYRKDQWPLLLETADDADMMIEKYDKWLTGIERLIENMKTEGIEPVKVDIDVHELLAYCRQFNFKNNGETRSQFIAELLSNGCNKNISNELSKKSRRGQKQAFQLDGSARR
jgi:hypothetical protein